MPRKQEAPRLWLRPARYDNGRLTHQANVFILHAGRQISLGPAVDGEATQDQKRQLAEYTLRQFQPATDSKDPSQIEVATVLLIYLRDIVPDHSRPEESKRRIGRISKFFTGMLSEVNGASCRAYAKQSGTQNVARRELEELRSAINHHRKEGLCDKIVSVVLPDRPPGRERFLDRDEAAKLLFAAWRRPKCRHVAKFILFALYTGRRSTVIFNATFKKKAGCSFIDVDSGMFYPPEGVKQRNKKNPPISLPLPLVAHLRRWRRDGDYLIRWGDRHSVGRLDRTLKTIARETGLGDDVTPHTLRHTACSWQMNCSTDMFTAGRYLGMTQKTLQGYAHHRPEHLADARDAYQRQRKLRRKVV